MKPMKLIQPVHPAIAAAPEPRGVVSIRADASDPKAVLAQLHSAFAEFTAKASAKDAETDGVRKAEIEVLNKAIGEMQAAMDRSSADAEARALNGGKPGKPARTEAEQALHEGFMTYIRTGEGAAHLGVLNMKVGGDQAKLHQQISAAATVGTPADGGYLAPIEWDRTITDQRVEISQMRAYSDVMTVTGQGFSKLFNLHGTTSGWVGETTARPQTNTPLLASYVFKFGEIYANPAASQHMLDDPELNFEAWLAGEVNQEFDKQEGVAFVSGDGVNKPKGILQYDSVAELALAAELRHPLGPVLETKTGSATLLTVDGLINIVHDTPSDRIEGAGWYLNRTTEGTVRKMKDADNNLIWAPSLAVGNPATILGAPVRELSNAPNVAAGTIPILFGNMKKTYKVFDRTGVRILRDPYTAKPYVLFYTTKRVGGGLWNPEYMRYHRVAA
jgi:HK97 family phage major capsid protein